MPVPVAATFDCVSKSIPLTPHAGRGGVASTSSRPSLLQKKSTTSVAGCRPAPQFMLEHNKHASVSPPVALQSTSTRRQSLLSALALPVALSAAAWLPSRPARAAAAASPEAPPAGETSPLLEKAMAEYSANEAKFATDAKALSGFRSRYGFRRLPDGRIMVQSSKGQSYLVRLDMEVPGTMLLRESKSGVVYVLQTDGLQQVDLSDDLLVLGLFADGEWERTISAVEYLEEEGGKPKKLTLTESEFRNVMGVLKADD